VNAAATAVRNALLLVAHGSPDPRAAAVIDAIADGVRRRLPCLSVSVGYLDHDEPLLRDELERLAHRGPVDLLPLLFAPGFHSDVDLPEVVAAVSTDVPGAEVRIRSSLGAGPAVIEALLARLAETGLHPGQPDTAVLVVGVGTTVATQIATGLAAAGDWPVGPTTVEDLANDVARLRADGVRTVAVSCVLLAPGVFSDRIDAAARDADVVAVPIGAHPLIVRLITDQAMS
jgi:sirohydrochlorin ferrochelatase